MTGSYSEILEIPFLGQSILEEMENDDKQMEVCSSSTSEANNKKLEEVSQFFI